MKHYIIIYSLLALTLTSCNKWLDVSPKAQVEDTDLFSNQNGYKEALAGVYSSMVSDNTYTKNMLFGAMDVLAQVWDHTPSGYETLSDYDYSSAYSESILSAIWSNNYNAIANVNNLLAHIDNDKNLFTHNNHAIIKGEALALRAMLHFDLLRCFGVSYEQNRQMPAIPYSTTMTSKVSPQLKVHEVAEKVLTDLKEAETLLAIDPILTGEQITEMIDNGYLLNRQLHLNYYAVKGLEARLLMWMQRYDEARAAARVILKSGAFPWANPSLMMVGNDFAMATEHVFALNNINMSAMDDNFFNAETQISSFTIAPERLNSYFEPTDYRYLYQFVTSVTGEWLCCRKYSMPKNSDIYYSNKIPLVKLGEMQLIEAECNYRLDGSGLEALNTLREMRGLLPLTAEPADFMQELSAEYRREFIAEGQLFFFYKRLNRTNISGTDKDMVAEKAYTFPLPKGETEAAEREQNR
ncbi:MAG: RagB/SusD family nutrient uptake outer membrane protein [Bacteroidaceae bacterium]|nr:RagB/SusD family nutrient uptake outer membrane protein [Bacteroidaceae bacterium]